LLGLQARAEDKAAALVVKTTGEVKVQRGSKQKTIVGKFPLQIGDKVVVSSGGSALVMFANGKKVNVTSTLEITEKAAAVDGTSGNSKLAGMAVSSASKGKNADLKGKSGGVGGMVRAAGPAGPTVQIVSVLNSKTLSTRPTFAWITSKPAESSSLELLDEEGESVWTATTKDTVAALPEDHAPLKPGTEYTLTVKSIIDGDEAETSSTFVVADEKESKEVTSAVDEVKKQYSEGDDVIIQHMLLSQYYTQKELYMDAISELNKLVALDPYDYQSHIDLSAIYEKIGDKADMKTELETAETIKHKLGEDTDF